MSGLQWRNRLARGTYTAVLKPSNAEVVSSSLTWSTELFWEGEDGFFGERNAKSSRKNYAWARTRAPCRAGEVREHVQGAAACV